MNLSASLLSIYDQLAADCDAIEFPSAAYVYNPLVYARAPFQMYIERFAKKPGVVMMLGMNPGPFGMTQTGIPFGAIPAVRDWMGIVAPVDQPVHSHPKRPVQGFACPRVEASGKRLWGFLAEHYQNPDTFFERAIILNYCPLVFMNETGANLTPDKLGKSERHALYAVCDSALARVIAVLTPRALVGIGGFALSRLKEAVLLPEARGGTNKTPEAIPALSITHPSPANPRANRGWGAEIQGTLEKAGLWPL